jgi:ammonia channel protein AmtB
MDARPLPSYIICVPLTSSEQITTILNIIVNVFFMLPCWITTYCYLFIGWKVNKKLNLMNIEAKVNNNEVSMRAIKIQKSRLILQILMVFVLYNVNIMFAVVTYFMRLAIGYKRPPFFDAVIIELFFTTIVFNPIITVSFQPDINNEIKLIFIKLHAKFIRAITQVTTR